MAKFLTSVLSSGAIKEGLEKGPAGVSHAVVGLAESAATKFLKFRTLAGVGLINPLLSIVAEPIFSEVKRQLFANVVNPVLGVPEHTALNAVAKDTAADKQMARSIGQRSPSLAVSNNLENSFESIPKEQQHSRIGSTSIRRFLYKDEDRTSLRLEEFQMVHRFYLTDETRDNLSVFEYENGLAVDTLVAGFNYCSALQMKVETEAVKEGTWEFVREVPLKVVTEPITLRKGILKTRTGFYTWLMNALAGKLTRRTLRLISYGRPGVGGKSEQIFSGPLSGPGGVPSTSGQEIEERKIRDTRMPFSDAKLFFQNRLGVWNLVNCFPVGYAIGDWSADEKAVQMAELTLSCEFIEELDSQNVY